MSYTTFAHTIAKPQKSQNGDHVKMVETEMYVLALLADGISSQSCDGYASQLACESVAAFAQKHYKSGQDPELMFKQALTHANEQLLDITGKCEGLGSTICGTFWEIGKDEITYFWIGDSRIFHFDQKDLKQLSKDDKERVLLSKNPRPGEPIDSRNYLTNSLGRKDCQVRAKSVSFYPGETMVMATDGFFESTYRFEKDIIQGISTPELSIAINELFVRYRGDQKDDASVVIVRREYGELNEETIANYLFQLRKDHLYLAPLQESHFAFQALSKVIRDQQGDPVPLLIAKLKDPAVRLSKGQLMSLLDQVVKTNFNPHGLYQELVFLIRKS